MNPTTLIRKTQCCVWRKLTIATLLMVVLLSATNAQAVDTKTVWTGVYVPQMLSAMKPPAILAMFGR